MPRKDSVFLFILAGIALAGLLVLIGFGRPVPTDLWTLEFLIIGGALGIARQPASEPAPPTSSTQTVNIPNAVAPQISSSTTPAAAAVAAVEGLAGPDVPA